MIEITENGFENVYLNLSNGKVVTNMKAMTLFLFSTTKGTDISNHEYVIGKLFFAPSSL